MDAGVSAILAVVIHSALPGSLSLPLEESTQRSCSILVRKYVGADWTARPLMLKVTNAFKIVTQVFHAPSHLDHTCKIDTE